MTTINLISFSKMAFWLSLLIILYSYVGYGILLWIMVKVKRIFFGSKKYYLPVKFTPPVALVVAAFNEEDFIEEKIRNTLELNYPKDLLELVFITDGSTDGTPEIIRQHSSIKLLHESERKGKAAAMNRSIPFINASFIVFCDANTLLNKDCILEIIKHYSDPSVGGVAGEKKIIQEGIKTAAASGEGMYWKYESFLKKLDSDLYSAIGAAGELFSVRKELFKSAPDGTILEDFVQSLSVCLQGFVLRYEPNAYASEAPSASIKEEMKRKVRICAGAFQAMILLKDLFNIFKYPLLSFQFISHRVLRWTICPVALIILIISNLTIVFRGTGTFYLVLLLLQGIFYFMAISGWILENREIRIKILFLPYYFLLMNISVFLGFRRFIRNKQSVLWEKASRQKLPKYH